MNTFNMIYIKMNNYIIKEVNLYKYKVNYVKLIVKITYINIIKI